MINKNFIILISLVVIACFSRIVPHMPNFTPIGAIALFCSSYFTNKYYAFIIPIISLWISDLFINNIILKDYYDSFIWFYPGFYWQYFSFILIAFVGLITLKKRSFFRILGVTISSSLLFFIITNFGVWISSSFYSKDIIGLIACYTAALPFYSGTFFGFIFYSFFLFGTYEFYALKLKPSKV
tara:strand:+ start:83 stop:631 length:549 start_codon:yes stop_codon:yes gene_type:complete